MDSKIFLYAEILVNIRQVTLYASLQTWKTEQTKIEVASDKRSISVHHDGETARLLLPTTIAGRAEIGIPAKKAKELSLRLEIEGPDVAISTLHQLELHSIWAANTMTSETILSCYKCHNVFHCPAEKFEWYDLPSQNWADMMDYWHCHKPVEKVEPTEVNAARSKGYAAQDKLKARPGAALIDTLSIILFPRDCTGVKVRNFLALSLFHSHGPIISYIHIYCSKSN